MKKLFLTLLVLAASAGLAVPLSGCGKAQKVETLPPGVYYRQAIYDSNHHDYIGAEKNFKSLIENYPSYKKTELAELKLGDAYYLSGKYIEAEGAYIGFVNLHPRSSYAPFAMYYAGMSEYGRMENPGRNQHPLTKAKSLFEQLISNYPSSKYSLKGFKYIALIDDKLAENEFFSGLYYYNASLFKPASYMFKEVFREYPKTGEAPKAVYYLILCYEKLGNKKMAARYKAVLLKKYPETGYAKKLR